MILQIGDKGYELAGIHDLSLIQQAAMLRELTVTNLSDRRTVGQVMDLLAEVGGLSSRAFLEHPEGPLALALIVWMARVHAGDNVSIVEAAGEFDFGDVIAGRIQFIREDGDPDVSEGKAAGRAVPRDHLPKSPGNSARKPKGSPRS